MMNKLSLKSRITEYFGHLPTYDQNQAIQHLSAFSLSEKSNPLYMLRGYAGTGKTSLISAYVKTLSERKTPFVLLAPTGRAAKVFSQYAGFQAHTIHRYIYLFFTDADGTTRVIHAPNKLTNAVFIVDEASMISDNASESGSLFSKSLLDDLFSYVYKNAGNKLILVGDTAQLPPVGMDISPALDLAYLKRAFSVTGFEYQMREVMRQSNESGILENATALRNKVEQEEIQLPLLSIKPQTTDLYRIKSGYEMEDFLNDAFGNPGQQESVIICRTNKRANLFNQQIRTRILQREFELEGGDIMMVVKNNYFWLDTDTEAGFVANGDLIEVLRVNKSEEKFGFKFADVQLKLLDYPEMPAIEVKLLLDAIHADGPDIARAESDRLFHAVEDSYGDIPQRKGRLAKIRVDPWYNALHVKFGYALTCHKTQGGQWKNVFIDQGYLTEDHINKEFLRWLYTAVTRATEKLYLMGFNSEFVSEEDEGDTKD